jgi:hypothetical protein
MLKPRVCSTPGAHMLMYSWVEADTAAAVVVVVVAVSPR